MNLGFIGLGQMGKPIAINLLKSGARLTVVNRSDRAFDDFRRLGVTCSSRPSDTSECDVIVLCLPDAKVVHEVLLGPDGLAGTLGPGQTVIDLSTIAHSTTLEIGRAIEARGSSFIDAPISGMEARAIDATLTVMCGGSREAFDRIKPLLDHIGNKILYMGPTGSGQLTKLINQLLFDVNAAALGEILPMSIKMGLDADLIAEVINSGTGRSYASEFFIPRILRRHFSDGYPMAHAYKDLISGAELSAKLCIPMPVLAAATVTYQTALLRGHGDKDKGAMVHVYEDLLGVQIKGSQT